MQTWIQLTAYGWAIVVGVAIASYLVGSIPSAYIIVRLVTGEDVTRHGTGNVGAMNVRRTTGSWMWFSVAMVSDALKGLVPVVAARLVLPAVFSVDAAVVPDASLSLPVTVVWMQAALIAAVAGHNYSMWMALIERRFRRTGKGLATGAGALLGYNPLYFVVVLVVGLGTIAATRYMMAGQVAAAVSLPVFAIATRQPDWPFALLGGAFVYVAHHRRFIGMLRGEEPKLYIDEGSGRPRG